MSMQPATSLPVHRLGVDTCNQIVAAGALEGERVEPTVLSSPLAGVADLDTAALLATVER